MSSKFKRHIVSIVSITVAALSLLFAFTVWAATGTTDSSAVPGSTKSYTLEDIYNRLDDGTTVISSTFTEPSVAPGTGTMYTLDAIMGAAPAVDAANGATAANVSSGKTFWGLTSGAWGLRTGTAAGGAGVPRTGQTTCWDPGDTTPPVTEIACADTGQDGDLLKDVAWPNPRFTDNDNGTVTDNLTGLIWLKNANCAAAKATWPNALSYSNALYDGCPDCFNGHGDCGLSDDSSIGDWRLPNVREMLSLVHYGFFGPAVPNTAGTGQWTAGDPFDNVQAGSNTDWYFSSTSYPATTTYAWCVGLRVGEVNDNTKAVGQYVWPVRGGQ